jgi:NAD(P)H-dependent flavin oxidoreductase YrpB (nitropropane dioxygenase family)
MAQTIETPLTKLLGIKYPVLLAGMNGNVVSTPAAPEKRRGGPPGALEDGKDERWSVCI